MGSSLPSIFEQFPIPTKQTVNPIDGSNVAYEPMESKSSRVTYRDLYEEILKKGLLVSFQTGYVVPKGYVLYMTYASYNYAIFSAGGNNSFLVTVTAGSFYLIRYQMSQVNATRVCENIISNYAIPLRFDEGITFTQSSSGFGAFHGMGYLLLKENL